VEYGEGEWVFVSLRDPYRLINSDRGRLYTDQELSSSPGSQTPIILTFVSGHGQEEQYLCVLLRDNGNCICVFIYRQTNYHVYTL